METVIKSTEKQTQAAISDYLSARKIVHRRTNSGMMTIANRFIKFAFWLYPKSTKLMKFKILDIDGVLPNGKYFACEVKATGKKPDEGQLNTILMIYNTRAHAFWADSIDIFIEKFERIWPL